MAPVRRYLRISRHSVLEVRVYLDNPADAQRWLLRAGNPALPRVIAAVRPLILPKLREESDRARRPGKKRGVKDVVAGDDFEVSIFLTNLGTTHAIVTKQRMFSKPPAPGGPSGGTKDAPVRIGDDDPVVLREEDNDDVDLSAIPDRAEAGDGESAEGDEETAGQDDGEHDDKKKLGMNVSYDGFRIHGRILCLVVKRTGSAKGAAKDDGTGQAMLEQWISSTQDNAPGLVE